MSILWSTVAKAADRSSKVKATRSPQSSESRTPLTTQNTAVSGECLRLRCWQQFLRVDMVGIRRKASDTVDECMTDRVTSLMSTIMTYRTMVGAAVGCGRYQWRQSVGSQSSVRNADRQYFQLCLSTSICVGTVLCSVRQLSEALYSHNLGC